MYSFFEAGGYRAVPADVEASEREPAEVEDSGRRAPAAETADSLCSEARAEALESAEAQSAAVQAEGGFAAVQPVAEPAEEQAAAEGESACLVRD